MKKSVIFFFLCIFEISFFAQEPPKMLKYSAKNAALIFYYDINEALEESKVNDDETKQKASVFLRNYNNKIKEFEFLNNVKLNDIEMTVNGLGDQMRNNPDLANRVKRMIDETIPAIRDSVTVQEKILNTNLKNILAEKQYKKWTKYQNRVKDDLLPKMPQPNRNVQQNNNFGGGFNGMGRRGF